MMDPIQIARPSDRVLIPKISALFTIAEYTGEPGPRKLPVSRRKMNLFNTQNLFLRVLLQLGFGR